MNRTLSKLWLVATATLMVSVFAPSLASAAHLKIRSPAIQSGGRIPAVYTCLGADKSPPLVWSGVPRGTKALAIIVEDPDAPDGAFYHWIAFNIPATSSGLKEGVPNRAGIPSGGNQGTNSFGHVGYGGPCPPPGPPHHYHFHLFALDETVHLGPRTTAPELERAMRGHVKASAELVAIFGR